MIIIKLYLIIGLLIAAYGHYQWCKQEPDEYYSISFLMRFVGTICFVMLWPYQMYLEIRNRNTEDGNQKD